MVSTFCDTVSAGSVGATGPTGFSSVGSVTLRADAKVVLGILALFANTAGTTAEGYNAIIRIKSNDLQGLNTQDFVIGSAAEGGVATNNNPLAFCADLIPLLVPARGGETISIEIAGTIALTTGFDTAVGILYANGMPPRDAMDAIKNFAKIPGRGGQFQALADAKATARAHLASSGSNGAAVSMKIPAWAKAIVGVRPLIVPDALATAGESAVHICELVSSMVDFKPQTFPALNAVGASLGTAILGGPWWPIIKEWPVWIPGTGKNETIDAYNTCVVASTGAVVHVCGIRYL